MELDSLSLDQGLLESSSILSSCCWGVLSSEIAGDWRELGEVGLLFRWVFAGAYPADADACWRGVGRGFPRSGCEYCGSKAEYLCMDNMGLRAPTRIVRCSSKCPRAMRNENYSSPSPSETASSSTFTWLFSFSLGVVESEEPVERVLYK